MTAKKREERERDEKREGDGKKETSPSTGEWISCGVFPQWNIV